MDSMKDQQNMENIQKIKDEDTKTERENVNNIFNINVRH